MIGCIGWIFSHPPPTQMADGRQTNGRQMADNFAPPPPFLPPRFGIFSVADGDMPNDGQPLPKSYTKPSKTPVEQRQKNTRSRAELVLNLSWICLRSVLVQSRPNAEALPKKRWSAVEELPKKWYLRPKKFTENAVSSGLTEGIGYFPEEVEFEAGENGFKDASSTFLAPENIRTQNKAPEQRFMPCRN